MFYSEPNGTIRNTCLLLTLTQHFLHKAELSNKPPRIYCLWRKQFLAFDGGQNENDEWLWQFDFWISTFLTVMMLKFKCKSPSLRRERLRGEQRGGLMLKLQDCPVPDASPGASSVVTRPGVWVSSPPAIRVLWPRLRIQDTDTLKYSLILDFACELSSKVVVCLWGFGMGAGGWAWRWICYPDWGGA